MTLSAAGVGTASPSGQVTSFNISISATGGAGRLILLLGMESDSATAVTVTSVSGLGGTWTKRTAVQQLASGGSIPENQELWYADFTTSVSGTVTVQTSAAGVDSGSAIALFVSSSTHSTIAFDTNASFPTTFGGNGAATTGGTRTVTSDSSAPYLLVCYAYSHSPQPTGPTPVSTSLGSVSNNVTNLFQYSVVNGGTPGKLTGATAGYTGVSGTGSTTLSAWTIIIDALYEVPAAGNTGLNAGGLGSGGLGKSGMGQAENPE